jgi:hypothetical protein
LENHYHKRLAELAEIAEGHLEEIPTDIEHDVMLADPECAKHFHSYEECIEQINAIQQELEYGKVLPLD